MKFFSTADFSENIKETPEGYLICEGVALARLGELEYFKQELPELFNTLEDVEKIVVSRQANDLFDKNTMASFEGKPVTLNHPPEFVNPENWREFAVGVVENVRVESDKLVADLVIVDKRAIDVVKGGAKRELSLGYDADYIDNGDGTFSQKNILGNHVAIVESGRCGVECAIKDSIFVSKGREMRFFKTKDVDAPKENEAQNEAPKENEIKDFDFEGVFEQIFERLEKLEKAVFVNAEDSESVGEEKDKALEAELPESEQAKTADAILQAGRILAPSVADGADYAERVIKAACLTKDGKSAIEPLAESVADLNMLVLAAAEIVKAKRAAVIDSAVLAKKDNDFCGVMTAEKLNELNRKFWGKAK